MFENRQETHTPTKTQTLEVNRMPCRKKKPTYKTKKDAKQHGAITYGKGKYRVRKVKGGWRAYKR